MSICVNPKCSGYCAQCPKVSLSSDSRHVVTNGKTYFDMDAERRLRELERDVVEKAKRFNSAWDIASVTDEGLGLPPLLRCVPEIRSLCAAVRALDTTPSQEDACPS